MKKTLFISAVALLSLSSCKKDYTCECTIPFFGAGTTINVEAKSSKKGAEEWCKSLQTPTETIDGVASPAFPLVCSLK